MPADAPFADGEHVYLPDHPDIGSMIVESCAPDGAGGWRLAARQNAAPGIAPWRLSADAADFCKLPEGWAEPPPVPALTECMAANEIAVTLWRELSAAWLRERRHG